MAQVETYRDTEIDVTLLPISEQMKTSESCLIKPGRFARYQNNWSNVWCPQNLNVDVSLGKLRPMIDNNMLMP